MKNRSREAERSTAGYTIGWTTIPFLTIRQTARTASTGSPVIIGTMAEPLLVPVARWRALASSRNSCERLRSRVTLCGSAFITRKAVRAAAVLGGDIAAAKTNPGAVSLRCSIIPALPAI